MREKIDIVKVWIKEEPTLEETKEAVEMAEKNQEVYIKKDCL